MPDALPVSPVAAPAEAGYATPSLRRRMACFLYEGVLLFGVVMIAGWLFSTLSQQRDPMQGRHLLQFFLFLVLGVYFIWFWSHGGQTVAMKTWHIQLLTTDYKPVPQIKSGIRYLLAWVWFLPGLAIGWWSGLKGGELLLPMFVNVVLWALLTKASPDGQFLHDRLAGTRLVDRKPR